MTGRGYDVYITIISRVSDLDEKGWLSNVMRQAALVLPK